MEIRVNDQPRAVFSRACHVSILAVNSEAVKTSLSKSSTFLSGCFLGSWTAKAFNDLMFTCFSETFIDAVHLFVFWQELYLRFFPKQVEKASSAPQLIGRFVTNSTCVVRLITYRPRSMDTICIMRLVFIGLA